MSLHKIQQSYEGKSSDEWNRLKSSPIRRTEYFITTHCLNRYLPSSGVILDAGSGPGSYTVPLAQRGYKVAMFDLVHEMLVLGRSKVWEAGVPDAAVSQVEGDIAALPYTTGTFDALISLGAPLSHLLEAQARVDAVSEMVRVLKPGGCLFLTCLARISLYRSVAYWMNEELNQQFENRKIQNSGIFNGWITGYAFQPGELKEIMRIAGVEILDEVGCEGLAAHLPLDHLSQIEAEPALWAAWSEILLETCNEPSIVGISSHLLVVGKKEPGKF